MDIVFIRELRIDTVIGIYDWEREIRQTVVRITSYNVCYTKLLR